MNESKTLGWIDPIKSFCGGARGAVFSKRAPLVLIILIMIAGACKFTTNGNEGNGNNDPGNGEKISKWDLWANGTSLRGANIYQRRVYPELDGNVFMGSGTIGPPYIKEDFNRLAAMGANYVNISHPGIFSEDPPYQLSQPILDHLKNLVDMIGNADMFAVISFRTGPGRSEFTFFWGEDEDWFDDSYYNDRVWLDRAAQDAWAEMWKVLASEFSGNPYIVGYDLMVEPNCNDVWFDIWEPWDFYPRYADTLYDWNQLYPRITDSIREVDTDTPILVGGMSYSAVEWFPYLVPTGDAKTVYMFHQYAPHVYTHQWIDDYLTYPGYFDADFDGEIEYVDKTWLNELLGAVDYFKANYNVMAGCNEYGLVRWAPGAAVFMDDLMDLFEQRGINYALWTWEVSYEIYTLEVNAFNFRFGPDPFNTSDVDSSELITVIKNYWSLNTHRPSNTNFTNFAWHRN